MRLHERLYSWASSGSAVCNAVSFEQPLAVRGDFGIEELEARRVLATYTVNVRNTAEAGQGQVANPLTFKAAVNKIITDGGGTIVLGVPIVDAENPSDIDVGGTVTISGGGATLNGSVGITAPSVEVMELTASAGFGISSADAKVHNIGFSGTGNHFITITGNDAKVNALSTPTGTVFVAITGNNATISQVNVAAGSVSIVGSNGSITNCNGVGLAASVSTGTGNTISDCKVVGISLLNGAASNFVRNNEVKNANQSVSDGIRVTGNMNEIVNNLVDNVIIGAGPSGIVISGNKNKVTSNKVVAGGIGVSGNENEVKSNTVGLTAAGAASTSGGLGMSGNKNIVMSNTIVGGVSIGGKENTLDSNNIGTDTTGKERRFIGLGGIGLQLGSSTSGTTDNLIKNNVIAGNNAPNAAVIVSISGATTAFNHLEGNKIGVNADGAPLGNSWHGIEIDDAPDNIIGGDTAEKRNIIGDNLIGISIRGAFSGENHAVRNRIVGNYIGVGADGTTDLGNRSVGISIDQKIKRGALPAGQSVLVVENNVISGNGSDGIRSRGSDLEFYGNKIGTNASGTAKLENGGTGILLNRQLVGESENVTIGKVGGGNVISGNSSTGISLNKSPGIEAAHDITIRANRIGTSAAGAPIAGSFAIPNGNGGIAISGYKINIGGGGEGEGNLVSGNSGNGISVSISESGHTINIQGNIVGLNAAADARIANTGHGISVSGSAQINFADFNIGRTFDGDPRSLGPESQGNVISGNDGAGVFISNTSFDATLIGNFIGTNRSGASDLGNQDGVLLDNTNQVSVGSIEGVGNVISGNRSAGIRIRGSNAHDNHAYGNKIGVDSTNHPLGNTGPGIVLENGTFANLIGSEPLSDGASTRNIIANNGLYGVLITGATTKINYIYYNYIGYVNGAAVSPGNNGGGIKISDGASDTTIQGNVISGHTHDLDVGAFGIGVFGTDANPLSGTSIYANTLGMDNNNGASPKPNTINILLKNATNTTIGGVGNGNRMGGAQIANLSINKSKNVQIVANKIGQGPNGQAVASGGYGIYIDNSEDITIGGGNTSDNVISNNGENGIFIGGDSKFVLIDQNSIHDNSGQGIELSGAYEARATRTVFQQPAINGTHLSLSGWLIGQPNTNYTLRLYANSAADDSGYGEGEKYFDELDVTTGESGSIDVHYETDSLPDGFPVISATSSERTGARESTYRFAHDVEADALRSAVQAAFDFIGNIPHAIANFLHLPNLRANAVAGLPGLKSAQFAALDADPIPTGQMLVYDNGVLLGSATIDSQGQAEFTGSALTGGVHNIIAVYEGDENFAGVVSQVFTQTIEGGPLGVSAGQTSANPNDEGRGVVVDAAGNSYVVGTRFYADAAADSTATKASDIYLAKYDKSGARIWQQNIGGTGDDRGLGIARDSNDNIYITGTFQKTAHSEITGGGAGGIILTSRGGFDIFVASFTSNGAYRWAHTYGNTGTAASSADIGYGITVDSSNKVIVTGQFAGTVDFDASSKTLNLKSKGGTDVFVLSLTSGGSTSFAKQLGGSGVDRGTAVAIDSTKRIYVAGSFSGTADFNPSSSTANLKSAGGKDAFVARLSSSGSYSYAKAFGGTSNDEAHGVVVDAGNNVYVTGYFAGTADLNPSSPKANVKSAGSNDVFVVKLNSSGNYFWGKRVGGTGDDRGRGIVRQSNGDVAVVGNFSGTVDFDPSSTVNNVASHGGDDAFVLRLTAAGNYKSALAIGGTGADRGRALAVDSADKLYALGQFFESLSLDTGEGDVDLTSAGAADLFLVRLV